MKHWLLNILFAGLLLTFFGTNTAFAEDDDDVIKPYQKKADIAMENADYSLTRQEVNVISAKYNGFIRKSTLKRNYPENTMAELSVKVPFDYFYDFLDELKEKFKHDILSEKISNEEELVRLYNNTKENIEKKEQEIERLEENVGFSDNVDTKLLAADEIDKLKKELEELKMLKADYVESLNYSTVNIYWQEPYEEEFIDTVFYPEEETIAGIEPVREIVFKEYGQIETFGVGEPVKIIFEGLDPEKTDIISKLDLDKGMIAMKVTEYGKQDVIYLETKCQIFNIGLGPIPEIIASEGISKEQIVITPRVSDDCELLGYEIRAGSIESGCRIGYYNLNKLKKCKKYKKLNPKKHKAAKQKPTQNILNPKELDWFNKLSVE